MNQSHCVPNYQEVEDDFCIPTSSGLSKPNIGGEEEIMELLWQNGQVVAQTQKLPRKSLLGFGCDAVIPPEQRDFRPSGGEETSAQQNLFIQEDEMASWLHYPLDVSSFDRDLYADLVYSSAHPTPSAPVASDSATPRPVSGIRPPPAPQNPHRLQDFLNSSRIPARVGPSLSGVAAARESTVVESNETPVLVGPWTKVSHAVEDCKVNIPVGNVRSSTAVETGDLGPAVSSSPSCSGASFSTSADRRPPQQKPIAPAAVDRKRKSREIDDNDGQNPDINLGAAQCKTQARDSSSTKKSRAAQVHNLSERRRRDRINEKMKALQDLIPRCNKSDKASMLDEAIEYLKSLQLQVQMMSMGCGMVPMMYPGMQQYQFMPMMGMGMDMNMARPMMSYPSMMSGSALPNPAVAAGAGARLSPCFPLPQFHMPPLPVPDPSRLTHTCNKPDPMLHQPRMSSFNSQCQQFFSLNQAQPPLLPQNDKAVGQSNTKLQGNPENHQAAGESSSFDVSFAG